LQTNRKRFWGLRSSSLLSVVIFALVIITSTAQALTLTGYTSPSIISAINTPCPEHPGYNCNATAYAATALASGQNLDFERAWNTVLPREWDPTGWTLQWATDPLNAVLNITTYQAYNYRPGDPQYGSFYAGAEIRVEWTPSPEQQDLKWIQALHTNRSRHPGTDWCLDIYTFTANQPPVYPYSYSDQRFYDKPSRWCESDQHLFWDAYLYLARVDRATKTATIYEGLNWGFTVDCLVPEPSSLFVLACGAGCILTALIRRKQPSDEFPRAR